MASIALVILIFHTQAIFSTEPILTSGIPANTLSVLQRVTSSLSVTVTSAVIIVAGKRYVLFKLTRGIRSQRVAVYANPSIGNLVCSLVNHGFELPSVALLAVWVLGLATALTVDNAWTMVPIPVPVTIGVPFGSFNIQIAPGSLLTQAFGQLGYVTGSVCSGTAGIAKVIEFGGDVQLQLTSGSPMGAIFYPPLVYPISDSAFAFSTQLNGFDISMEPLSSIPATAQSLVCVEASGHDFETGLLWYEAGDSQTLSVIAADVQTESFYRFNASAIILGGTLQSTGNATEFLPNGTTWPNVMPNDQWAQDIATLVCNATYIAAGEHYFGSSLLDFAVALNLLYYPSNMSNTSSPTALGMYWSTVLNMAMGAYSSAWYPLIGDMSNMTATLYDSDSLRFTARYGTYVLIANIVVSAIMLVVIVRLRMASHLGGDFINATRLLLDPLKDPKLFNATLGTTLDALGNPYMLVKEHNEFLLGEQPSLGRPGDEELVDRASDVTCG